MHPVVEAQVGHVPDPPQVLVLVCNAFFKKLIDIDDNDDPMASASVKLVYCLMRISLRRAAVTKTLKRHTLRQNVVPIFKVTLTVRHPEAAARAVVGVEEPQLLIFTNEAVVTLLRLLQEVLVGF